MKTPQDALREFDLKDISVAERAPYKMSRTFNPEMKVLTPLPRVRGLSKPVFAAPTLRLPLVGHQLQAGFPSPADDYVEGELDINDLLIRHKAATFFCRVKGNSMEAAGIFNGDLLIVDRAVTPASGQIIVASVDGDFVVKRLVLTGTEIRLEAASPEYAPIILKDGQELTIWGVVTGSVRQFR